ncbi:phosphoribosylglycinamide formyltransferase [Limnobacter alexandrii]|uniref:phosphoribosylglycinamide formyltransferase n=1 Tax=Limnobacter alexandrii TaxID=2570352 RepID=UPI001486744C|nr:formyltransferase family protein [Limnobacter alexandrii]
MKKILFLASGGGGNFRFVHQGILGGYFNPAELYLIADRGCGAIEYAKNVGIPNFLIEYSRKSPEELRSHLLDIKPDLIITNWHKIIDADTVRANEGKFINLHYSLLPAFGGLIGLEPIKKAYEQGCKFIGPTCHFVDEGVDTGRIITQAIFTTDRPFEESVTLMFRSGCVTLLNGMNIVLFGEGAMPTRAFSCSEVIFDQPSTASPHHFNEQFWSRVANT